MKSFFTRTLAGLGLFGYLYSPISYGGTSSLNLKIQDAPTKGDWQRFHVYTDRERVDLWSFHRKQNLHLKDWAWQWRLGWLRSCGIKHKEEWCQEILKEGLQDQAMVVRAEAATQIGRAYTGTQQKDAIQSLVNAYDRKDNYRNGKPLFVCEQILNALRSIGGKDAIRAAQSLSNKHPQTKTYWNALNGKTKKQSANF